MHPGVRWAPTEGLSPSPYEYKGSDFGGVCKFYAADLAFFNADYTIIGQSGAPLAHLDAPLGVVGEDVDDYFIDLCF